MKNRRENKKENSGRSSILVKRISIALAIIVLISVLLFLFYPQFFKSMAFKASRTKNAFSHYILKEPPHFYYLEMEKNGKDIRIGKEEALEITYQDEFVIKAVASDDLTGKYTTVSFEKFSEADNDSGVLMKGLDFVNKIIREGVVIDSSGAVSDYKILVKYRGETIDAVGLKIVVTPQDWFRFAKESSNVRQQIEYLKKAVSMNERDVSARKILAGVYSRQNMLDEAISQYKDVLKIKSDDTVAMEELAKCYIKKKEFDEAIKISESLVKTDPKNAQAYVVIGLAYAEKGIWPQAAQNLREAVRIEPDN